MATADRILVTDFDGTITKHDFYKLVVSRLLTPEDLAPWTEYRAGKITHFTALQRIFSKIRASESALEELALGMEPDPRLREAVVDLQAAGWDVVVTSAGCDWYISRVLAKAGVELEVFSNPTTYAPDGSLHMRPPVESAFYCAETGVDKAGIVRSHRERGAVVAFAGDGFADLLAALEVDPARRFARADLAAALGERGEGFRPFSIWSDVARELLDNGGSQ